MLNCASYKRAADFGRTADYFCTYVEERKIIEDKNPLTLTLSSNSPASVQGVDYSYRQLPEGDVSRARFSQASIQVNLFGSKLYTTVFPPTVNVCGQRTYTFPAAALISHDVPLDPFVLNLFIHTTYANWEQNFEIFPDGHFEGILSRESSCPVCAKIVFANTSRPSTSPVLRVDSVAQLQ